MWANILFPTHFLIESYATSILFKVLLFQNHHFFHNMNGIQTSCLTICDELGTALTFYNLALFSIYGNDGTTISTSGVMSNNIAEKRFKNKTRCRTRMMILFISNSWRCFPAKSLLYPHLKVKLKLSMH